MAVEEADLTRHGLRTAVAQICLAMGWTSIHSQPLDIMVDVLHRYIGQIGRSAQARANLYGRTDSNLLDLSQVFEQLGVSMPDLEEYVANFEVAPAKVVPAYPLPAIDDLNILKPGSQEVLHRPQHVHSHLPAMYPDLEEKEEGKVEEEKEKEEEGPLGQLVTPDKRKQHGAERSLEIPKQADDGCQLREISSVMMTSSGFLSPCREGKMPDSKRPHVDPEEKKAVSRKHGDKGKGPEKGKAGQAAKKDIYNRDAMIKQEMMSASQVKMEAPDYEEDFEDMIEVQQVHVAHKVKEERPEGGDRLDSVMESVIRQGLRESERLGPREDGDGRGQGGGPEDVAPKPSKKKGGAAAARKPAGGRKVQPTAQQQAGPPPSMADLFSAPQHFTAAGGKTEKKKMARIPKITEQVSLPSPDSLGLGGMAAGHNPLIPNPLMNFYGLPAMSPGLIPGLSGNLLGQMAMMQQVQAAASLGAAADSDITAEDEELEEGEISPPRTPTAVTSFAAKKEKSPDVEVVQDKQEKELEKEKEKREKEKEAEERRKLVILAQERDRLKEVEDRERKEKEKEREREAEKAKEKERIKERGEIEKERLKQEKRDFEKEKKKAKKEKKDKDKEKSKEEKEKSKKEKKKEKKEKKKEKKEKDRKPDEPNLFAPGSLKIKVPTSIPPSKAAEAPAPPAVTPKLVIKNLAKPGPAPAAKEKEAESVPMLGFQPLRTGPARTPKADPAPKPVVEKRKASRPPGAGPGPSREKKVKEGKRVKSKETVESSVDSGDDNVPGIITETVGSYTDEAGNKVWICPACGKQDDGSPMIGCDQCDDWYHWLCVGINSEPSENQDWFCTRCMAKKQGLYLDTNATFHPKQRRK